MSEPSRDMRALIEQIAKALVDEPGQVSVSQIDDDADGPVLELKVAASDMGKVIGRQGRAMRNLLSAVGVRSNKRFTLDILE